MTKKILLAALLFTGMVSIPGVKAQLLTQTNAQLGDLILGFETTGGGGTKNLLVDLGSVTNEAELISLDLNLKSDLTNAFGSGYAANVSYGLYSVTSSKEIYASGPTNQAEGYPLQSSSTAANQKIAFQNFLANFNTDGINGQKTTHGVYENTSEIYSWTYYTPSEGAFLNANYTDIEVPIGSTEDLFAQPTGSSANYGIFTDLSFTVSDAGLLTVAAVPEPSVRGLLGLGILLLGMASCRRKILSFPHRS